LHENQVSEGFDGEGRNADGGDFRSLRIGANGGPFVRFGEQ
jgi:hypothetical protein